jgi:hypothetical protein
VVNRGALILRYKEPAVRWIREVDPDGDSDDVSLESVNEERTIYLINQRDGADLGRLEVWLKKNYAQLFELELEGWYTDPELWPRKRSYEIFREWFAPEYHSVLNDLAQGEIFDDEA